MSKGEISEEDKALFLAAVKSVTPLKKSKKQPVAKNPVQPLLKKDRPVPQQTDPGFFLSDFIKEEVHGDSLLNYSAHAIPAKRLRELKAGLIPWEASLDLHGSTLEEARKKLTQLIIAATHNQWRSLLIIHGKGGMNNQAPVLKNLVNNWLKQIPQVLAFHSALAKDGGNGAVYVLLKSLF